jgi:hypothetical protein
VRWAIVYFGLNMYHKSSAHSLATFFHGASNVLILRRKMGCAAFWATFSQTHLVTLPPALRRRACRHWNTSDVVCPTTPFHFLFVQLPCQLHFCPTTHCLLSPCPTTRRPILLVQLCI